MLCSRPLRKLSNHKKLQLLYDSLDDVHWIYWLLLNLLLENTRMPSLAELSITNYCLQNLWLIQFLACHAPNTSNGWFELVVHQALSGKALAQSTATKGATSIRNGEKSPGTWRAQFSAHCTRTEWRHSLPQCEVCEVIGRRDLVCKHAVCKHR